MTRIRTCLALAIVLLSPTAANALLIEGLCDGTADTTVTCDTDTGLEWLDLTETVGLSGNQFLADVGGWVSEGWSLATGTQVDALLTTAGFVDLTGQTRLDQFSAAQTMLNLFGATLLSEFGQGLAIESATLLSFPSYRAFFDTVPGAGSALGSNRCCVTYDQSFSAVGIWANRETVVPVPEPGTLALLGVALAGLGLARRKRAV